MKAFLAGLFSRLIRKDNDTTTTITLDYGTFRGKNVKQTISFLGESKVLNCRDEDVIPKLTAAVLQVFHLVKPSDSK
jgi:hypothetical protein